MYRLGFDIGGTNVASALIDEGFNIIKRASAPFPHTTAEALTELMSELLADICRKADIARDEIELIGVCIPGSIDKAKETVIDAYNLNFHNVRFKRLAEAALGRSVQLMNDADAAAIAEYRMGSLKGKTNSMLITIGTGIGGGIILGGKLFSGGRGNGVELGHVQMELKGEKCTCGRFGCIETLCSASWLNRKAAELYLHGNAYLVRFPQWEADGKRLIEGAMAGNEECLAIWDLYVNNLAEALASYTNLLDPERIAIGGGVSGAGDFLIRPLAKLTGEKCFFSSNPPEVVRALLGNDAGLTGSVITD